MKRQSRLGRGLDALLEAAVAEHDERERSGCGRRQHGDLQVAHEGAHVRRYDPLRFSLLRAMACALFWLPALRRLADALETGQRFEIQIAGERISVPGRATCNIELKEKEEEIRASWEPGLSEYKQMRKKYLLYP